MAARRRRKTKPAEPETPFERRVRSEFEEVRRFLKAELKRAEKATRARERRLRGIRVREREEQGEP